MKPAVVLNSWEWRLMTVQLIRGAYLKFTKRKKAIMHARGRGFSIYLYIPGERASCGTDWFHTPLSMHTKQSIDLRWSLRFEDDHVFVCALVARCIHFLWLQALWWRFDWPLSGSSFLPWWWQMARMHVNVIGRWENTRTHTHTHAHTHTFWPEKTNPAITTHLLLVIIYSYIR